MKKISPTQFKSIAPLFAALICALSLHPASLLADEMTKLAATPVPKAEPSTNATPQVANDDLSQYKTADALYAHYEEVSKQQPTSIHSREEATQYFTKHLHDLDAISAEFEKRYPKDPRHWNMEYANLSSQAIRSALGIQGALKEDEVWTKMKTIFDAPDAPTKLKKRIAFILLRHDADSVHDVQSYAVWQQKVKAFSEKHTEDIDQDSVQLLSALVMAKFDSEKAISLFTDLAKTAKDPNVAAAAKNESEMLTQRADETKKEESATAELKKAPLDIKFTAVDGRKVDLAKLRGKVVLVDFWATWCGPCMAEVPTVVATYKALHDKGFEIVGISFDQDKASLLKVTKEKGMVWPQYFDGKGWGNDFGKRFGVRAIPAMWLVNKKGYLVTTNGREDLRKQVEKLLAE